MARRLTTRGTWPGPVVLRSGWDRAYARPANDDSIDASLRLDRGSTSFLQACAEWLFANGAGAVVSAPLGVEPRTMWQAAGFSPYAELVLLERDLSLTIPPTAHAIRAGETRERARAAEIDGMAFEPRWRIGRVGLDDAFTATRDSTLLVVEDRGEVAGFAVVGAASPAGYLQRIAVDPSSQSRGLGRSLVRASLEWARARRAYTMLLNTQPDNERAIGLYRSERFEVLRERLLLVRAEASTWPRPPVRS